MIDSIQGNYWSTETQGLQVSGQKQHRPPDPEMLFKKIDANQDGKVDKDELSAFASQIEEKTGQKLDIEQMFEDYDKDQDGVLSKDELGNAMKSQMGKFQGPPPAGGPGPEEMFKKVDQDGDGEINQNELQSLLSQLEKDTGKKLDAAQLLSQYDSDQDGSLNFDDFDSLMKNEVINLFQPDSSSAGASSAYGVQSSAALFNLFDVVA